MILKAFKKAYEAFKEEIEREKKEILTKEERFKFLELEHKKHNEKIKNYENIIKELKAEIKDCTKFTDKKMIMLLKYYDFKLVGSRNLKVHSDNSDYDFMTTDREKFVLFIEDLVNTKFSFSYVLKYSDDIDGYTYEKYIHLFTDEERKMPYAPKQQFDVDGVKFDICLVTEVLSDEEQLALHNGEIKNKTLDKI